MQLLNLVVKLFQFSAIIISLAGVLGKGNCCMYDASSIRIVLELRRLVVTVVLIGGLMLLGSQVLELEQGIIELSFQVLVFGIQLPHLLLQYRILLKDPQRL